MLYDAGPSGSRIRLRVTSSAKQPATVLITASRPALGGGGENLAVFRQCVMIRYLDFQRRLCHPDPWPRSHPQRTPSAALLSSAETRSRSGRDLITATVLAYECSGKIADVYDYLGNGIATLPSGMRRGRRGWLAGIDADQMVTAIGITVRQHRDAARAAPCAVDWKAFAAADACRQGDVLGRACPRRHDRSGHGFRGTYAASSGDGQQIRSSAAAG